MRERHGPREAWLATKEVFGTLLVHGATLVLVIGCLQAFGIVVDTIFQDQKHKFILGLISLDTILAATEIMVLVLFASAVLKKIIMIVRRVGDTSYEDHSDTHRPVPFVR